MEKETDDAYEELVVDGVLSYRNSTVEPWTQFSALALTVALMTARRSIEDTYKVYELERDKIVAIKKILNAGPKKV
jgi:hypothetical protein